MPTVLPRPDAGRLLRRLAEAALGLAVLGLVLGAGTLLLAGDARARVADALSQREVLAEMLAHDVHRLALDAHGRARIAALSVLDGAAFDPPRDEDGDPLPALAGWSQAATLVVYDPREPSRPLAEAFHPGSWDAGRRVELVVTIRHDGVKVGTWRWWIAPPA